MGTARKGGAVKTGASSGSGRLLDVFVPFPSSAHSGRRRCLCGLPVSFCGCVPEHSTTGWGSQVFWIKIEHLCLVWGRFEDEEAPFWQALAISRAREAQHAQATERHGDREKHGARDLFDEGRGCSVGHRIVALG